MRKLVLLALCLFAACAYGQQQSQNDAVVLNQTFLYGPATYLIATLPANDGADYDHLHLLATVSDWGAATNSFLDLTFGNRNAFTYSYTSRGGLRIADCRIVAYQNTDSSVSVYIVLSGFYVDGGYSILEADEEMLNPSPSTPMQYSPGGTLVFDSSSALYPPSMSTDYAGNIAVQGNVNIGGISQPNAALVFPDGTSMTSATPKTLTVSGPNGLGLIVSGTNLGITGSSAYSMVALQNSGKLLLGWNATGGMGEQDLIANRGAGSPGGFIFWDYSNSGTLTPLLALDGSGNLGLGTTSPGAKFELNGNMKLTQGSGATITFQDQTVQTTAWNGTTLGGDYAESIDVDGPRAEYEPGDVIALDASAPGKFLKSATPYSPLVAGVYSTKPGLVGRRLTSERPDKAAEVPMAMMGIAPVKVCTENGPVAVGDLLVSASKPGYAMKGTDRSRLTGSVIGKAMAPVKSGAAIVEVLISLQ